MAIARPTWFKVGISLVFWFGCYFIVFAANSRTLQKNEVLTHRSSGEILLEFNNDFLNERKKNIKFGQMNLLSGSIVKNNQFSLYFEKREDYPLIKVYRIQNSNLIKLYSNPNTSIYNFGKKNLIEEIDQRVKNENFFLFSLTNSSQSGESSKNFYENSPLKIEDWGETILTLVISLIFILLLIYFIAFCYKRFFRSKFSSLKSNVNIRQVSSYYVGPKQKVIVFDINGRKFACGVTLSSINLIAELYDEIGNDDLNLVNEDGKNYKKNNKTRSKFLNALEPELKKKK